MPFQKLEKNQRFKHSLTTTNFDGVDVTIKEDGHVVLRKEVEGFVAPGEEYDELEVKAGTIFKIAKLLQNTRSIVTID